jgi:hypothetical protein
MEPAEKVALLALIYRACYLNRHSGPDSALEDIETCPGEVSLATLYGTHRLTEPDWQIMRALGDDASFMMVARAVAEHDPVRAEALLHAASSGGEPPAREWAYPLGGQRWHEVERAMEAREADGFTLSRDDVDSIAVSAYAAATGMTRTEVRDEFDL